MPDFSSAIDLMNNIGPGTELGNLLRRYWLPVTQAEAAPADWQPPQRVRLLGENLVLFRDSTGGMALLQELCAHRRASLYFGRTETENSPDGQPGLRCAYHGWKYDLSGQCIDMPNEPPHSRFKDHVKIKSYPVVERGGVLWAYFGPPELKPALPELEWVVVPRSHRYLSVRHEAVSFTQAMDGGIDSSHISLLHADTKLWRGEAGDGLVNAAIDPAPRFFVEPTEYGLLIGARRKNEAGYYWRVTQWVMPCFQYIPRTGDGPISGHAWVPIDDENCWAWTVTYHPDRPLTDQEIAECEDGFGIHAKRIPGTNYMVQSKDNDYHMDRNMQRLMMSISGIYGVGAQDAAVQESMGPTFDPANEMLGSSDAAVVAMRARLIAESRLVAEGQDPSALNPEVHRIRSASAYLPEGESWIEATAEARKAVSSFYTSAE